MQNQTDNAHAEVWVLGIVTAVAAGLQLAFGAGLLLLGLALHMGWRGDLPFNFDAAMLCLIIGVGLYVPLVAIVASLGEGNVPERETKRWSGRFWRFGPVALFVFWWRYIRPQAQTA